MKFDFVGIFLFIKMLIKNKNNTTAFRNLADATLALTILFNRQRIDNAQYFFYLKDLTISNQTEYLNQLTESERVFISNYNSNC